MKKSNAALMLMLTCALWSEQTLAYLDPGTGSLILQSVIAGIAGAFVVTRLYWEKLKSIFAFNSNKSSGEAKIRNQNSDVGGSSDKTKVSS